MIGFFEQKIAKQAKGIFFFALFAIFCLKTAAVSSADYEIQEKNDSIRIESTSHAVEHHSQVVRILTEEGAAYKEYLGVNGNIQIKNLKVTITSGGKSWILRKEQIYEVPVVESPEMVTDYKAIVIDPQNLNRGDLVTIEYDRTITSLLYIDPWVYATNVPVRRAFCTLNYPTTVPVKFRGEDASVKVQKTENMGSVTLQFEATGQEEVSLFGRSESFGNVEKRVVFIPEQAMTERWALSTKSWKEVAVWFSELTKFAYREDPMMDAVVQEVKRKAATQEEIAEALYQYIQKNFIYMAIEVGIGGYKPRFASHTFQKKYGDCKDLTFLYLALLRKAGIEGYPALVDTRHARFFYNDFPSPTQFNHVVAYLPRLRNGIWVDTTVKNFRLGEIPAVVQGKKALVAGGINALVQIPEDFYNSSVLKFELNGSYAEKNLRMSGFVHTLGQTSAYVDLMKNALMRNAAKNYIYGNLLKKGLPVQKLQTETDGDRSLRLSFETPIQALEQYHMLLVNAVNYSALENLGIETQQNEYYALGNPMRLVLDSTIDLAGRALVSRAESAERKGNYVSYKLVIKEEEGKLRYIADVYFANGFLDHLEMKRFQEELQEFAALLQRTVIIH